MARSHVELDKRMLDETLGQYTIEIAKKLRINRTFIAGYLEAIQEQGNIWSKRTSLAKDILH